jgi:hypothetical protein
MPKKKHSVIASKPVAGIGIGSVIHHRIVRTQMPSKRSAGVTAKPGIVSQTSKKSGPRISPQKFGFRHGALIFNTERSLCGAAYTDSGVDSLDGK